MNNYFSGKDCKKIYDISHNFLLEKLPSEINANELDERYFNPKLNYNTLQDLFDRLIDSAQNYQGMPNFIRYNTRKERIKQLLFNYDLLKISELLPEDLYYLFKKEFKVQRSAKNIKQDSWYKWSKSVIDSAKFLTSFKDTKDFKEFIGLFQYNIETKTALPLLISTKISGIGFPLACDFLKEIGYTDYPKPDVHIKDIIHVLLKLNSEEPISNILAFETIIDIASKCKITPYKLDKILWLICTGNFYNNPNIKPKSHKKEFLEVLKNLWY